MTPARSLAASVVALGFAGTLTAPSMPAYAAPAPCERAEHFAAQSGAELLRIEKLQVRSAAAERPTTDDETEAEAEKGGARVKDAAERVLGVEEDPTAVSPQDSDTISEGVSMLGDAALNSLLPKSGGAGAKPQTGGAGGGAAKPEADGAGTVRDVGVGEARTALIADARVKSAALARMLAGRADSRALTDPVFQQAPPSHDEAAERRTPAGEAGPVSLGDGRIGAHARWSPGMACGTTVGEAARAETSPPSVSLLQGSLVRMPERATSVSTTGLERRGGEARSVASATVTAGRFELADGRVRVRVLRPPTLLVGMSTHKGGDVRYVPAVVEVSGDGIGRKRLQTAGDQVDVTLRPERRALEDTVSALDGVREALPLPVPPVPGLPRVPSAPEPEVESAPAGGTRVRISLGEVRQARKGHAIAARATAIKVMLTRSGAGDGRGTVGYGPRSSLTLGVGLLEAAAVAPESVAAPAEVSSAGTGGGLPITGPRVDLLALGGVGLLMVGIAAVLFGRRRRS